MKKKPTVAVLATLTAMMMIAPGVTVGAATNPTTETYGSLTTTTYGGRSSGLYKSPSGDTEIDEIKPVKSTDLVKVLEIDNNANVPKVDFTFTISAGTATPVDGEQVPDGTLAVKAGINPGNVKWGDYTSNSDCNAFDPTPTSMTESATHTIHYTDSQVSVSNDAYKTPTFDTNSKSYYDNTYLLDGVDTTSGDETYYAEKKMQLDFSGCGFVEPGIYRYIITESNNTSISGITYDVPNTRTIDVYVYDGSYYTGTSGDRHIVKNLYIKNFIMYKGTVTTAPKSGDEQNGLSPVITEDGTQKTPNGLEPASAVKSIGFKNKYTAHDITFGKAVTGNQGSRDKYFKFTINLNNVNPDTTYDVIFTNAVESPAKTTATTYDSMTNPTAIKTKSATETSISQDFYLCDGQYITIEGLPDGTKYTITELYEDYTSKDGIAANLSVLNWNDTAGYDALTDPTSNTDTGLTSDVHTGFTNTRQGIVPTGVLVSVAAPTFVGLGAAAGIIYLLTKKKKRDEE